MHQVQDSSVSTHTAGVRARRVLAAFGLLAAAWAPSAASASPDASPTVTDPGDEPIMCQIDSGILVALDVGSTRLGEVRVVQSGSVITEYYNLSAALPTGATSITMTVSSVSQAPATSTFSIAPVPFTSSTAPSSSSTTFVNTAYHIGLNWGFRQVGSAWTGSATWYHNSSANISLTPGTYTLYNATNDASLTYKAVNTAP